MLLAHTIQPAHRDAPARGLPAPAAPHLPTARELLAACRAGCRAAGLSYREALRCS